MCYETLKTSEMLRAAGESWSRNSFYLEEKEVEAKD